MNRYRLPSPFRFVAAVGCVLLTLFIFTGCSTLSGTDGASEDGMGAADGVLAGYDLDSQREARFSQGDIPTAEGDGVFRDVNFGFDSYSIDDLARQSIEYNAEILRSNPEIKVQLEGHCDERGTAEYNMALGSKRATSVYDILLSYGIPRSRIETISYGAEVPLDTRQDEQAWARNRRVHFSAFRSLPQG